MTNQDRERYTFKNISTALCIILFFSTGRRSFEARKKKMRLCQRLWPYKTKRKLWVAGRWVGSHDCHASRHVDWCKKDYESLLSDFTQLKNTKSETKVYTETRVDSVYVPTTIVDTMFVDLDTLPVYRFVKDDEYFLFRQGWGQPKRLSKRSHLRTTSPSPIGGSVKISCQKDVFCGGK